MESYDAKLTRLANGLSLRGNNFIFLSGKYNERDYSIIKQLKAPEEAWFGIKDRS